MPLGRSLEILWEYHPILLSGLLMTFQLTFISIFIALATGVASALGSLSRLLPIRWLSVVVIEFCRNTPILVLIIWVHYALPEITGIKTTAVTSCVIALVMQSTGYLAEEYRAGIESIDKGQFEAARSVGMTYARLMRRIILPQAVVRMIPGIINQLVVLFKSTSVVSIIAVPDLMYNANVIVNDTYLAMQTYTLVALTYFLIIFGISVLVRVASKRIRFIDPSHLLLRAA
jgi:polar amino acid transport system permease protein